MTEREGGDWLKDSGELLVSGRYKLVRYTERSTNHVTGIPPAEAYTRRVATTVSTEPT